MSLVGRVLGKYRVVEQVGRGGMGTVYRAVDETLHRDVALKILNAELNDPGVGRRFHAEAVAIARLNHPGIATIFELFQHDGQWLMAIEFVRGQTLEDLVGRSGPLSIERSVELVSQALAALGHAHGMGVVHRDLKPANLMLAESGRLKVMDFGIARVAGTEHLTSAGFLVGTPAYMAPEQVLGQDIDARTDLYAIGCVMFFLVTGKLPFPGTTPLELAEARIKGTPLALRAVQADLPVWLEQVLERALARDPASRHQSADAFREALRRGIGAPAPTTQAVPASPAVSETISPGSLPVSSQLGWPPAAPPTDELGTAETRLLRTGSQDVAAKPGSGVGPTLPGTTSGATTASPAAASGARKTPIWPVLAAVAIVIAGAAWWFRSRGTPPEAPPPEPPAAVTPATPATPPVEPPANPPVAVTPPPDPATGAPPPAGTPPSATGTTPSGGVSPVTPGTPGAPGAITAGRTTGPGRRGAAAEVPVSFEGLRLLKVTGRRGEDFDADFRFGGGAMVIAPRRPGADQMSLPYKELQRATFTRDPNPKWVTNSTPALAAPPLNLDVPGFGVRSRRWLVLQSTTWFAILTLPDEGWEQILNTIEQRTPIKIDRLGPAKD
jgi:serine/threonine-protein kinase